MIRKNLFVVCNSRKPQKQATPGILVHQLARTYLVRLGGAGAVLPLRLVVGLRSCTKLALLTGPGPLLNVLSFVT